MEMSLRAYHCQNHNQGVWYFDFDGTLVDIELRYTKIYEELVRYLGYQPIENYWFMRRNGLSEMDILRLSNISENTFEEYDQIREQKLESTTYLLYDKLFPYVKSLFKILKTHNQKIYILTHRWNYTNLENELVRLKLRTLIDGWSCTKDKTEISNVAHQSLSMANDQTNAIILKSKFLNNLENNKKFVFLIGDSISDIEAAKSAQVNSISIPTGLYNKSSLIKKCPTYFFDSIKALYKSELVTKVL